MYKFKINDFEGPLDLLIHLVYQADVDIYDINLVELVNQYLDFINEMEKLELNIASEYIAMAAELIELKSRSLLPSEPKDQIEDEVDPRQELIERLIEYKKYKEITSEFKKLEKNRKNYYSKAPSSLKEYTPQISEVSDISLLISAFNELIMHKREENIITKTTTKEYSVTERSKEIKTLLKVKKRIEFSELFEKNTKDYIIVTFLALLEMVKTDEIKLIQESNFAKIYITGGNDESGN